MPDYIPTADSIVIPPDNWGPPPEAYATLSRPKGMDRLAWLMRFRSRTHNRGAFRGLTELEKLIVEKTIMERYGFGREQLERLTAKDLANLLRQATTPVADPPAHIADPSPVSARNVSELPDARAEWSTPRSKAEWARRYFGNQYARSRKIDGKFLQEWQMTKVTPRTWKLRLDLMDPATRERME